MKENEIFAERIPEPSDLCICDHRREQHTANQHCRTCQCPKFNPKNEAFLE